ncbi:hypothetical protein, conserved [Eimeria acervulina]|uniref:Uncharacterized protein n=1 Tax=Eimeria acervulina TaxID=5801 RepID=U6GJV9_EIMAC|nr:hypothetical protein, conserved [Eimeria acervulina]CDI80460.1 hypothetical protein, conserved [Eimeria acervulina]
MLTVAPQYATHCAVDDSTAHGAAWCGECPTEESGAAGLNTSSRAASCAARSPILQLQREYPAAFAAVAAAAASTGKLRLLQDPLWLAAIDAVHAWRHSTNVEEPSSVEAADLTAAAEEGGNVAEAIREAARAVGEEDPLVRLQAAVLLGEAAALLHSISEALTASSLQKSAVGYKSTVSGSEHNPHLVAAADRAAHALELWHFRLMALPVSVSLLSLGSRGAAPWKPRPCSSLSGVAATPLLQRPAATDELLLLHQKVRWALGFLTSADACSVEKIQPLRLRCMQALQQAQQLALQLGLPAVAARAGAAGEAESAETGAPRAEAAAAAAAAADTAEVVLARQTCGGAALPLPISSLPRLDDRDMNWQLLFRTRGAVAAPGWNSTGKVQHRQQESPHWWPKSLSLPLGHLLWSLRSVGKKRTSQEVLLSRGFFLPTVSPHWRGEFMGCATDVAAGSAVEGSFLLKHAAKLHALLTSSLRPELALR